MLYICIREELGSNYGQDTDYPEAFRGFTQSLHANFWIVSHYLTAVSFHILSIPWLTNHSNILCYRTISNLPTAFLQKLQVNENCYYYHYFSNSGIGKKQTVFSKLYSITSPVRDQFLSLFVQTQIQSVPRDLRPIKLNKFGILSGIRAS
jgi:hypothetical protein